MLYICATPLGNLGDITIRTLDVFRNVDYIACEDTRHTIKLLNHYGIKKKLMSFDEHSEFKKQNLIVEDLKKGLNIALVSDAGMPGIQDPGQLLIKSVIENELEYTVLPGASALITAIVGSGLSNDEFLFLGFLPRKSSERVEKLKKYKNFSGEIILYESPHRFLKLLQDIDLVLGNREIVIAREISKKFEEYKRTTVKNALELEAVRGEIVLIIKGEKNISKTNIIEEDIIALAIEYRKMELGTKMIAKKLSEETGISKNRAYEIAMRTRC